MKLFVTENFQSSSRLVADMIGQVVREKKEAMLGLATGSSMEFIYKYLVQDYEEKKIDFSQCFTINIDEYMGIGKDNNQSFAYYMYKNIFEKTNFKEDNIFLIDGHQDIDIEVFKYNNYLIGKSIDFLILGIGTNGHIGFNEPESKFTSSAHSVELAEETIKVNSRFFKKIDEVPKKAMTIGMRDIVKAKKVVLIASGGSKVEAIRRLFIDDFVDPMFPCSILKLCSNAIVVVDKELAQLAGLEE
jgi:6-phosphogluconolactonase/Glucosamine-6-phosphate isomerase/deaminase